MHKFSVKRKIFYSEKNKKVSSKNWDEGVYNN